jgi:hypothetical protein
MGCYGIWNVAVVRVIHELNFQFHETGRKSNSTSAVSADQYNPGLSFRLISKEN